VSLDALDLQTLSRMTDAPVSPERILEGIDAAANAGLHPVKVNMVVRRGLNDHCVAPMAERFRHSGHVLRFIEYVDVGPSNGWRVQDVMPAGEILAVIDERWPLQELPAKGEGEVASRYRYRDGAGEIGLIHSISKPFCGGCTRLRLSADGKLYTCLFATEGHDVRALLRGGGADAELGRYLRALWSARADRYSAGGSDAALRPVAGTSRTAKIEMSYIGG
jgi:GTP 3',8-cyclase